MKTKFYLLLFFLLSLNAISLSAQIEAKALEQVYPYFFEKNKVELQLSDEQVKQIYTLDAEMNSRITKEMDEKGMTYDPELYGKAKLEYLQQVLNEDQLHLAALLLEESAIEEQEARITSSLARINNSCPEVEMTREQAFQVVERRDSLSDGSLTFDIAKENGRIDPLAYELKTLEGILSEEQLHRLAICRKAEEQAKMMNAEEKLRKEMPVIQAYAQLYIEQFIPKLRILRARFDRDITNSDKVLIEYFQSLIAESMDLLAIEAKNERRAQQISDPALKQSYSQLIDYGINALKEAPLMGFDRLGAVEEVDSNTINRLIRLVGKYQSDMMKYELEYKEIYESLKVGHQKIEKQFSNDPTFISSRLPLPKYKVEEKELLIFLLTVPAELEEELADRKDIYAARAYPSPAHTNQTLELNIPQSGNLVIDIIDQNGSVLQSVFNGNIPDGPQKFNVDISRLEGSVLYYRIISAAGQSTLKILITK
ncbi:MAG: hypothetical protein MRY78_21270 [Saprospiraceae bacterium]|nr:hypothetical protein [Saprospiraceae bacterium]